MLLLLRLKARRNPLVSWSLPRTARPQRPSCPEFTGNCRAKSLSAQKRPTLELRHPRRAKGEERSVLKKPSPERRARKGAA